MDDLNRIARDYGFRDWDDMSLWDAGKYFASKLRLIAAPAPVPVKTYYHLGVPHVLRFQDGSVFLAEPYEVWTSWSAFLAYYDEFAQNLPAEDVFGPSGPKTDLQ